VSKLTRRLLIAAGLTLSLSFVFILLYSAEPQRALRAFFLNPFTSRNTFLTMLELAAPLLLCALGSLVAFRAGHFNLGGEGQLYAGACLAALIGSNLGWFGFDPLAGGTFARVGYPLICMLAGIAGGSLVALLPALGRRWAGAEVLLTSFLVSQAALLLVDSLIGGALRDTSNNLVAMLPVAAAARLQRLARPSALTLAPVIAFVFCLLLWFIMERTKSGHMLTLYGKNRQFARLMAYPVRALALYPMLVAGALHGLAGALMVLGINGTAIRGMSGGLGWSAIGVALIASNKPAVLPLAALLFAWLDAGARQASVLSDIPADISMVIKAVVIIGITAKPVLQTWRIKRFKGERL